MALTSSPSEGERFGLADWRYAGLDRPTYAKPVISTVLLTRIERKLGSVSAGDQEVIAKLLRASIAEGFLSLGKS